MDENRIKDVQTTRTAENTNNVRNTFIPTDTSFDASSPLASSSHLYTDNSLDYCSIIV